jgi:hypothetical protein
MFLHSCRKTQLNLNKPKKTNEELDVANKEKEGAKSTE